MRLILAVYVLIVVVVSVVPAGNDNVLPDKLAHFLAYTLMAVLALLAFHSSRTRIAALVAAVALGAVLELVQGYLPTRQMSLVDAIANTLGVTAGGLFFQRWGDTLTGYLNDLRSS